jgi:hypothetical protein
VRSTAGAPRRPRRRTLRLFRGLLSAHHLRRRTLSAAYVRCTLSYYDMLGAPASMAPPPPDVDPSTEMQGPDTHECVSHTRPVYGALCTCPEVHLSFRSFSPAMDVDDANGPLPMPSSSHASLVPSLGTLVLRPACASDVPIDVCMQTTVCGAERSTNTSTGSSPPRTSASV